MEWGRLSSRLIAMSFFISPSLHLSLSPLSRGRSFSFSLPFVLPRTPLTFCRPASHHIPTSSLLRHIEQTRLAQFTPCTSHRLISRSIHIPQPPSLFLLSRLLRSVLRTLFATNTAHVPTMPCPTHAFTTQLLLAHDPVTFTFTISLLVTRLSNAHEARAVL